MKRSLSLLVILTLALPGAFVETLDAKGLQGRLGGGGGGGGARPQMSRAPSRSAPKPKAKPSYRPKPQAKPASRPKPQAKPASRPKPQARPSTKKPSSGGARLPSKPSTKLPSKPSAKPSTKLPSKPSGNKPTAKLPDRPSTLPAKRPDKKPDVSFRPETRPSTKPATRPKLPDKKPSNRPDIANKLPNTRPDLSGKLPTNRPDGGLDLKPADRPNLPGKGDGSLGDRFPDKGKGDGSLGDRFPGKGDGGKLPGDGSLADRFPGNGDGSLGDRLPNRPGGSNRPGSGDRWGNGNRPNIPDPPGRPPRPAPPELSGRWQDRDNTFNNVNVNFNKNNQVNVNNFRKNQKNEWNNINRHRNDRDWYRRYGTPEYRDWRRDTWRYRGNRCRDIWYRTGPYHYHDNFFNHHWYSSCWWRPTPFVGSYRRSPWWWWRPVAWTTMGVFFGNAIASQPVVYDPGTTVIYEGDTVYIDGESAGSATEYRQETIYLANPEVEEIPIPEPPPVPEGVTDDYVEEDTDNPEGEWLPVGVWALTQQEDGDATMFFQLSVNKDGLIGGAYKNVMTGDEQPVVGQVDFEAQRVAWHIGEVETTVYEAGLSNFENDVASVFVHFGPDQTQEWLLVRMPSPEMPPETVKLPEIAQE